MKTKSLFLIASIIALIFLCPSCEKQTDYTPQINSLQTALQSLQKRSDSLATALSKTNSNLQTTNTNVSNLSSSITSIQTQVSNISSQIATLNSQLTSTNANVSTINGKITDLNNQLSSLLLQLNALLAQQTVINSLQASLNSLQKRSDSIITVLNTTKANLQITNNNVSNLGTSITSLQAQGASILAQIAVLNFQLNTTNANVSSILSQINDLSNQYSSLSAQMNFVLTQLSIVIDVDGNVYHTVTIGSQVWMVENLKTTKYNDGSAIPNVTDKAIWMKLSTGSYCWYGNDNSNKTPYGALYNWFAVKTGKLSPKGWHVPSDTELNTLYSVLGGVNVAGGKLKESGTVHWSSATLATNESGFTALPGGYIGGYFTDMTNIQYYNMGLYGYWWSSTEVDPSYAISLTLICIQGGAYRSSNAKQTGFSVRCIKD